MIVRRDKDNGLSFRTIQLPAHILKNIDAGASRRDMETSYVEFLNAKDGDRYVYSIAGD